MEPLVLDDPPAEVLVLMDSAPVIYVLEGHPKFGPRFKPLVEAHGAGDLRFAVTTITVVEGWPTRFRRRAPWRSALRPW